MKLLKNELGKLKYEDLLKLVKQSGVINGFDYGKDEDGTLYVEYKKDGDKERRKQPTKGFDFVVEEAISRLSALPHIEQLCIADCEKRRAEGILASPPNVISTAMYDSFDFLTCGASVVNGQPGLLMRTIEVKNREDKRYTKEFFEENGVMVDLHKQSNALMLYTQSYDGYGYFFNMDDASRTGETVADKTTVGRTGDEKIKKEVIYFDVKDAVLVCDPVEVDFSSLNNDS